MKRRAPDEQVSPFRHRYHSKEAEPIRDALAEWCAVHDVTGKEPELPEGIEDRAADCWEPLIAIADEAGGDWPKRAREAATALNRRIGDETLTRGVELLGHIREAFGADEKLWTETLLERLCGRAESPWKDIYGKPLNDRGLASRLKPYGIKSVQVRDRDTNRRGYTAADFHDAWDRYCPLASGERYKRYKRYTADNKNNDVADVAAVAEPPAKDGDPFANMKDGSYKLRVVE